MAGKKSQTSSTSSEPWKAAQPALQLGLNDAMTAYRSGLGSQPYTGSTVVPFANQTTQAFGEMERIASAAQPAFDRNFATVYANARKDGLNDLQSMAVDQLKPLAAGKPAEGLDQLNDVQNRAYSLLNPIAGGSMVGRANPYLDDIIKRSSEDIALQENLAASGMGRYGSGVHQGAVADSIGDFSSRLRLDDYNNQLGRQDAAIRDIFGIGNQANAQYESDMARKLDATGSIFNAGQQAQQNIAANTDALEKAYSASMAPSRTRSDIGSQYEDLFGRQLNDQLRIFQERQQQPWNQIAQLNAIASGAGRMGGSGQAVAQGPSRLSAGLGGALGGATLFPGPLGAIGGGLLGLFG